MIGIYENVYMHCPSPPNEGSGAGTHVTLPCDRTIWCRLVGAVYGNSGRGPPAEALSARRHFKFLSHYSMAWPGPRLPRLPVD